MNRVFPNKRILERSVFLFVLFSLVFTACLHTPYAVEEPSTDLGEFIEFFEYYQTNCPYFAYKGINWVEIVEDHYTEATLCENEDELAAVMGDMLANLQDPAIRLDKFVFIDEVLVHVDSILPYIREFNVNYSMDVLEEVYLERYGWAGWEDGYRLGFGWCDPENLPYMFLDRIPVSGDLPELQEVMDSLDAFVAECIELDLPAVIIDIRMNPYGNIDHQTGACGHEFMGRFAAKSYPGAIYRRRSGPEYHQYYDNRPAVFPTGPDQFTGTVILLVGENTIQRAENMTAAFINFPNVVLVGETTGGNVSWLRSLSLGHWNIRAVQGTVLTYDKVWIEGNGIPADHVVEATEADFAAGIDPVLDYAIEMLDMGTGLANEAGVI